MSDDFKSQVDAEVRRQRVEQEERRVRDAAAVQLSRERNRELAEGLARAITGPITAASLGESKGDVDARLREALGFGGVPTRPMPPKVAIDPEGDPLELLSPEERKLVEGRPYLKKLMLEDIAAAEAGVTAEREKQRLAEEREHAHAENDRTHEIARRLVEQRRAAREGG